MRTALAIAVALLPAVAAAAILPTPGFTDPHIQTVAYDPDQMVLLRGAPGRQIMVEFGPGERLENVAIGDSLAWQVTPNKRADLLFIKPIRSQGATNMTVVTSERRYVFELAVAGKGDIAVPPYVLRFDYPQPAVAVPVEPPPEAPPRVVNADYVLQGPADHPTVFDDGEMTYFQWPPESAVPAIFSVAADGSESLVNYAVRGDYVVVEQLGPRFVLRNGKEVVTVVNRGYRRPPAATIRAAK